MLMITNKITIDSTFFFNQAPGSIWCGGHASYEQKSQAQDSQGHVTSYAIDNTTSTITQMQFVTGQAPSGVGGGLISQTDTYVFSDFRQMQGVLTPFKIERYSSGMKIEEMDFGAIQYNAGVSATAFKP